MILRIFGAVKFKKQNVVLLNSTKIMKQQLKCSINDSFENVPIDNHLKNLLD